MIYITSDIHARKEAFNKLLDLINFNEYDEMYVLGDVLDRGQESIALLIQIMNTKNIHLLMGNHELYAILCLDPSYTTNEAFDKQKTMNNWSANGGYTTACEYKALNENLRCEVLEYLKSLKYFENITLNNQSYILAHSYMPVLEDECNSSYFHNLKDMIRLDFDKEYFENKIFISGHTPTWAINSDYKNKIFKNKYNINVDCGMKTLGCICLDNLTEYYI